MADLTAGSVVRRVVDLSFQSFPSSPLVNMNPGAENMIRMACTIPELRAFLVLEHGHVVAEYTRPDVDSTVPYKLISTTKSWLNLVIGMIIQDGLLSLDETLGEIFVDEDVWKCSHKIMEEEEKNLLDFRKSITVKELLTMTSGLELPPPTTDADGNEHWNDGGGTLSEALVTPIIIGVASTSKSFHYLGANNILSYIVSQRTEFASPREYLEKKAFPFLGIPNHAIEWQKNKEGMELSFYGLSMTPTHMAKLGQLFLQQGRSSTTHSLIHEDWIDASTCSQSHGNPNYGYLWWVYPTMFCAQGLGGQDICVSPLTDRVIVQQRDFNFGRKNDDTGSAMGLATLALSSKVSYVLPT